MINLAPIDEGKDLVNKEYVDRAAGIHVLASAEYKEFIASSNTSGADGAKYCFLKVKPTDFNKPVTIRYRITITPSESATDEYKNNINGIYDVELVMVRTAIAFNVFCKFASTTYYPIRYSVCYYLTNEAGFNADQSHLIGIYTYNSYLPTTATCKRDFRVEVLGISGGTFELAETISTFVSRSDYSTTYHTTTSTVSAVIGSYHSGDQNTTYTINYMYDAGVKKSGTGSYAISRYALCMQKPDMCWEKIVDTSKTYSTATTKTVNTRGFLLDRIRYYNTTTVCANGANLATNTLTVQAASIDARYSTNCGTPADWVAGNYFYLVGTLGSDGLFYLDTTQWWSVALPTTEDGKLYIQIGSVITSASYSISLYITHPIYYYKDGAIHEYKVADNKQDVITDLDTIRAGAAIGNALPAWVKKVNLELTDMPAIPWSKLLYQPTTLSGYGISDAKIENGVITLGDKTITPLTQHQSLANYLTISSAAATYLTIADSKIAIPTVEKSGTLNAAYNNLGAYYNGSATKAYYKIEFTNTNDVAARWPMISMRVSMRHIYNDTSDNGGYFILNGQHNSTAGSNWSATSVTFYGNLNPSAIKIYFYRGSSNDDKDAVYISARPYGTISIDKILCGDNVTNTDIRPVILTNVAELPETAVEVTNKSAYGPTILTNKITSISGGTAAYDKPALSIINSSNVEQARIGTDSNNHLGLYAKGSIYLRPSSSFASSTIGLVISSSSLTYNGVDVLTANDISAWAKAATKPSYAFSEITGKVTNTQLTSSSINIAGSNVSLGGTLSAATLASAFQGTSAVYEARLATEAIALKNVRKLWGNDFDGSADVTGAIELRGKSAKIIESLTGTSGSGYAGGIYGYGSRNTADFVAGVGFYWTKTASNTAIDATIQNVYMGVGTTPWVDHSLRLSATAANLDLPLTSTSTMQATQFKVAGGTASQFMKANGTLDSTAYLPLTGGNITGSVSINANLTIQGANTLRIGEATLAWDGVHQCLRVDKSFYSDIQIAAGAAGDSPVPGGSGDGSIRHIPCTQEQYDAWVEANQIDPFAYYFIEEEE